MKDPLAISVCAQHCNGGISANIWWESSKQGNFVIGEANGNHGVHRPGGGCIEFGASRWITSKPENYSWVLQNSDKKLQIDKLQENSRNCI